MRVSGNRRPGRLAAATMVMVAVAVVVTAPGAAPAAAAPPGGGYHFDLKLGSVDAQLSANVPFPLTGLDNRYVNISVNGATVDGALRMGPCGQPATEPLLQLVAGEQSPTLFFVPPSSCLVADAPTGVYINAFGALGPDDEAGYRYVAVPDEPHVVDSSTGQPWPKGNYEVPLGAHVPPSAGGVAVLAAITSTEPGRYVGITFYECGKGVYAMDYVHGPLGTGDRNVAHIQLTPGSRLCMQIHAAAPVFVDVVLLGYFTDTMASGGDIPPSFDVTEHARPGLSARPPQRVLDTRAGLGAPAGKVAAGSTLALDLAPFVGSSTEAVTLNVTATDADGWGYITAFACDQQRAETSNVNYDVGRTVPNLVTVAVDAARRVCLSSSAGTHLLADLAGTWHVDGGDGYQAVDPTRMLDTRATERPSTGSVTRVAIGGTATVPHDATAATFNLTAVDAGGYGYVTAFPCDQPRPEASNVNHVAGQTVPNLVTVKLAADGTVCLYTFGSTDLIVDLAGYYAPSAPGRLLLYPPSRWQDTRLGSAGKLDAGYYVELPYFEPTDWWGPYVQAIITNLTVTETEDAGFLSAWPCGSVPETSNLNYSSVDTVANQAVLKLATDGSICVGTSATTHVLVDLFGELTSEPYWRSSIIGSIGVT